MGTQVQWRGGTTEEHETFTGASREISVDIEKKTLVIHDGKTQGGFPLAREDLSNVKKEDLLKVLDISDLFSLFCPTGMSFEWWGKTAPQGFLLLEGQTIGSENSDALLKGDTYKDLFLFMWDNINNENCPVSDGRTSYAIDDWNADKILTLPDARRKVFVGCDYRDYISDRFLGATGGEENHLLEEKEMPEHAHLLSAEGGTRITLSGANQIRASVAVAEGGLTNENFEYTLQGTENVASLGKSQKIGGNEPHNNMPPYLVVNRIIKT